MTEVKKCNAASDLFPKLKSFVPPAKVSYKATKIECNRSSFVTASQLLPVTRTSNGSSSLPGIVTASTLMKSASKKESGSSSKSSFGRKHQQQSIKSYFADTSNGKKSEKKKSMTLKSSDHKRKSPHTARLDISDKREEFVIDTKTKRRRTSEALDSTSR